MYTTYKLNPVRNPTKQRGAAVLAVGLILLFTATIITIFAAKVGVQEQRISGNEYRYKMAFEAAQAGLEYGQMYLNRGKQGRAFDGWGWQSCSANPPGWNTSLTNDPNNPCIAGTNADDPDDRIWFMIPDVNTVQPADTSLRHRVFFITEDREEPTLNRPDSLENLQFTIVSEGTSDIAASEVAFVDQRSYAFNRMIVETKPMLPGSPHAPMIAAGVLEPSGTADIVTAPNAGGGRDTPVSVWSKSPYDSTGNFATCYPDEFYRGAQTQNPAYSYDASKNDGIGDTFNFGEINATPTEDIVLCESCTCPTGPAASTGLTNKNNKNIDILDQDPNFPPDLFEYLFGIPWSEHALIKNDPNTTVLANCSGLNKNSSGLIWVTGNCDAPSNTDIGTPINPLLLVVDGEVKINANSRFFGILYASPATSASVTLNGGPDFYGAMIIDRNIKIASGGYSLIYHDKVLTNLLNNLQILGKVPGTWTDYL